MATPEKRLRKLLHRNGYTPTSNSFGVDVFTREGRTPVEIRPYDMQPHEFDDLLRLVGAEGCRPNHVDEDDTPEIRAAQKQFDLAEKERRHREHLDRQRNRNNLLGGASRGLPVWMVDQLDAATEDIIRQDRAWRRLMEHRPFADITD